MRLSTRIFSDPSRLEPEIRALIDRIDARDPQPPKAVLGPATALADLSAAVNSTLAGRGMDSRDDRASLRNDLVCALDELGAEVKLAAAETIAELHDALPKIPKRLRSVGGAQRLQGLIEASRLGLGAGSVILAAWEDVLSAFRGEAYAETCELRLQQLAELAELGGGGWSYLSRSLGGVLRNDRLRIAEYGGVKVAGDEDLTTSAGLSLDERLALCVQILVREPRKGDSVVWLGFANAMVPQSYLRVGVVEFFSGELWPDALKAGWPNENAERREELSTDGAEMLLFGDPPSSPFALARVPLGETSVVQSGDRARRMIQDLIRAARPGSEWQLMDGAMTYVRGKDSGWFGASLQEPWKGSDRRYSPGFEPTARRLGLLDHSFVDRLLASDPRLHAALRDIDWLERISELDDPAQQVGLGVRLIERLLPKDEHWTEVASHYLKDMWVAEQIYSFITDVAHNAVGLIEHPMPILGAQQPWRQRLLPPRGSTSYAINLAETIRAADELIASMPPHMLATKTVIELAERTADPAATLAWRDELNAQFDRLLSRLVRQRNAVLHGGDTHDPVTESVKELLGRIQGTLATLALDAVRRDVSLSVQLEERRNSTRRGWAELQAGVAPIDALFDAEPDGA